MENVKINLTQIPVARILLANGEKIGGKLEDLSSYIKQGEVPIREFPTGNFTICYGSQRKERIQEVRVNFQPLENYHYHYASILEEAMVNGIPSFGEYCYNKNSMGANGNHRVWEYDSKWFVVTNDKELYSFFSGGWSVICFSEKPLVLEIKFLGNAEKYGKVVIKLK